MKWFLFLFMAASLSFVSCSDDDDGFDPNALRYDNENDNSPALPAGDFEAAAYFPASFTADFPGRQLTAVEFFPYDVPDAAEILVSRRSPSTESAPGDVIVRIDVRNDIGISPRSWNTVELDQPIDISDGIWISYAWSASVDGAQYMGCDAPGSGQFNGDWLFDSNDNLWRSYTSRFGERINWNIRGRLNE